MSTITKERIELFIKSPLENGLTRGEQMELARIALASLEAKPIGAFHIAEQQVDGTSDYLKDGEWPIDNGIIEVYAAPPVPVVPEEKPMPNPLSMYAVDAVAAIAEVRGWNACRAAMLQAGNFRENKDSSTNNFRETSETSTNSPVIPDGLSTVCAEAYQVVGVMADALGVFGDAAVQKVLDNLSQQKLVHRDVLPFSLPVTPDGWISCSERIPAQDDWVLIYSKHGEYMAGQVQGEYVELSDGTLSWLGNALYWMLLPEPPQGVNDELA
ncbi:TPA: DUF551 domain-containing protein [Escherichia coli]|nr:DUF551 domain-containing protein [Escherichia coli]